MGLELSRTQFEGYVNRQMDSSATSTMPFQPWQTHQHALHCSICQKYSQHRIQMFPSATQSHNHPSPYTNHVRCLGTHNCLLQPLQTP